MGSDVGPTEYVQSLGLSFPMYTPGPVLPCLWGYEINFSPFDFLRGTEFDSSE